MKTIQKILLLCVVIIFTAFSCEKENDDPDAILTCYDETQCNDPWDIRPEDAETISNIKKYLSSRNIIVLDIQITKDGINDSCRACPCRTGRRIKVKIKSMDLEKIIEENFYVINK